ncbi:MAG: hypothetical protein AAB596_02600 [Patescibacteria group bacterium]
MIKKIVKFFDKLEDKTRTALSRQPIIYALIGGIGVVLFWRGIWITADYFNLSGLTSIVISIVLLLITGLFVSFFIGDRVIISGLKQEKKIAEKTEAEVKGESDKLGAIETEIKKIEKDIDQIKSQISEENETNY